MIRSQMPRVLLALICLYLFDLIRLTNALLLRQLTVSMKLLYPFGNPYLPAEGLFLI